jgi:hypothetical protein
MLPLETMVEIIVALLLAAVIVYCAILDKRLAVIRSGQDALRDLIAQLSGATATAERAVLDLRLAADASGADLNEKVKAARPLADELAILIESGSAVAARLERSRGDFVPSQPSLLKALKEAR